jgi:hypothetical protein
MGIRQKFVLFFVCAAFLPLLVFGTYSITSNAAAIREDIQSQLHTLAKIKQNTLRDYLQNVQQSLASFSKNPNLIKMLQSSVEPKERAAEPVYQQTFSLLLNYQETVWGRLHHIFITDVQGNVILSPPHGNSKGSHLGHNISESKYVPIRLPQEVVK